MTKIREIKVYIAKNIISPVSNDGFVEKDRALLCIHMCPVSVKRSSSDFRAKSVIVFTLIFRNKR